MPSPALNMSSPTLLVSLKVNIFSNKLESNVPNKMLINPTFYSFLAATVVDATTVNPNGVNTL